MKIKSKNFLFGFLFIMMMFLVIPTTFALESGDLDNTSTGIIQNDGVVLSENSNNEIDEQVNYVNLETGDNFTNLNSIIINAHDKDIINGTIDVIFKPPRMFI